MVELQGAAEFKLDGDDAPTITPFDLGCKRYEYRIQRLHICMQQIDKS